MSLKVLAADKGMTVESRRIALEELAECQEAAQCGTAAVLTPISVVFDPENNKEYTFGDGVTPGKWCTELYNTLVGIQYGDVADKFGWITFID